MKEAKNPYYVYLLRCADDSLYCGMTNNPENRLKMHNEGKGGHYTRSHRPCRMVYLELVGEKGDALRREREIKGYDRARKLELLKDARQV